MRGNRHLERRIIQPFENALNALENLLTWEYTGPKGIPLSKPELDNFTYETFMRSYIRFEIIA